MPRHIPLAIVRAAEVRAHGGSWAAAAESGGWTARGLHRWVRLHVELWAREVGRARRFSRDEACDESVAVLRSNLRGKDRKLALESTKVIGSKFQPRLRPKPPPPKDLPAHFLDLLAEVPEERATRVDRHLKNCEEQDRTAAGGGPTGAE